MPTFSRPGGGCGGRRVLADPCLAPCGQALRAQGTDPWAQALQDNFRTSCGMLPTSPLLDRLSVESSEGRACDQLRPFACPQAPQSDMTLRGRRERWESQRHKQRRAGRLGSSAPERKGSQAPRVAGGREAGRPRQRSDGYGEQNRPNLGPRGVHFLMRLGGTKGRWQEWITVCNNTRLFCF